jgi:stearoyl-CoA desaturase (delta-9 desaturase)
MHAAFRWFISTENVKTDLDAVTDLARYPELRWINRFYAIPFYGVAGLIFAAGAMGWLGPQISGWSALLWGFEVPATLVLYVAAAINVLSHLPQLPGGYRRFDTPDKSTNRPLLGIISAGVGFHNNHHREAACARCGFAWWELDVSYYFILILRLVGLAWGVRSKLPDEVHATRGPAPT